MSNKGNRTKRFLVLALILLIVFQVGINVKDLKPNVAFAEGETVIAVEVPNPDTYEVMVGTAFDAIGLPTRLNVVYKLADDKEEIQGKDIKVWSADDPENPYNKDIDGKYVLKAVFDDESLDTEEFKRTVTVKVKGQALADEIKDLPSVADAGDLSEVDKTALRSKLIDIDNGLGLLSADERTDFEAYVGPDEMGKFQELYDKYVLGDGSTANFLEGDWVYLTRFEMDAIHDGVGPFDTSDDPDDPSYKKRKGNDSGPNNGIVRTFDTVTYDLSYVTAMSGEHARVKEGYIYYEFILPYTADQAEWEFTGMTWIGTSVKDKTDLATKRDGDSYYHLGVRDVDGVESQVITGKKFLAPVDPNPSAFPGRGTLNAVVRVLNMDNGSQLRPKFSAWMEHNHTDGTCPTHNRDEVKTLIADPVTVTSELRMNVQLMDVATQYANGLDTFDFDTGNVLAMNKGKGKVYGRLAGYGITIQAYNIDPNDGLKGVAFPTGPITFELEFATEFRLNDGPVIEDLPDEYTPLVWSYERNKSGPTQEDGRDIRPYVPLRYGVCASPYSPLTRTQSMGTYSSLKGTTHVWKGGNWTGSQTDNKVYFTVDNYEVNPNWFPNGNAGDAHDSARYYTPSNGVRFTNIGAIASAELFIVVPFGDPGDPFGEGENYLPKRYGNGTVYFTIKDVNLRAETATGDSLEHVTDNSNQTKPTRRPLEDDTLSRTVYLAMPGTYENVIRYIYSDSTDKNYGVDETHYNISNGRDTATRGQDFAILWGGTYNPNGEKVNAVYGLNALMKFDPTGLEFVRAPKIHTKTAYLDPNTTATFLYATKADGSNWDDDAEMDAAVESNLVYYKSLDDVPAGHVVVGILAEARNNDPQVELTDVFFSVQVKAKSDAVTNKVYQIVERTKVWRKAQYDTAGGVIPRRYDVGPSVEDEYPAIPAYKDANGRVRTLNDYSPGSYTKAIYDDGAYVGGHKGSSNIGDSIYLTPYTVAIKKSVAQKAGEDEKKVFDLDAKQRTVDFKLSPSILTLVSLTSDLYADVVIEDVLPKGLSYVPNSAYYGGTYTQNAQLGRQGTVTGGVQIETTDSEVSGIEMTTDYNTGTGETTLTWIISKVRVNDPMPDIIFSATIGEVGSPNDVENGDQLVNKVSIRATDDNRAKTKLNGNYDESGISVAKLNATSLAKLPESKYIETGDNAAWKAYVSNNSANEYKDTVILDVFPYNGDNGGSKFNSATVLSIVDWSVDPASLSNLSGWKFFYTTDEAVQGTIAFDHNYDDIINEKTSYPKGNQSAKVRWEKATLDQVTGKITTDVTEKVTAVAALGTLKGGETLVQNIHLSANPHLKAGDVLANSLSRVEDETDTPVYVLQRTLEGLLWHDDDADGIRQTGEVVFKDGTITLLVKNSTGDYVPFADEAKIPLGKQLDLNTGDVTDFEEGKYKFVGLPAGMFAVRFETGKIHEFTASPQNVGSDYTDSDAEPELNASNVLKSTIITDIKMPAKHEMASSVYASRFNDSGLYARTSVSGQKMWVDGNNKYETRPESILIRLWADGVEVDSKTVTAEDDWKWSFTGLNKYEAGVEISYTITEEALEGYETSIDGNAQTGFMVENHLNPVVYPDFYEEVEVSGSKIWIDGRNKYETRPESIRIRLLADGEEIDSKIVTADDDWSLAFIDLPKYNYESGVEIVYTITEDPVEGYIVSFEGDAQKGFTIKNRLDPKEYPDDPDVPKTGEAFGVYQSISLTLLLAIGVILLIRRKRRAVEDK